MVMLADTKLRSQVEALWDKLWSGGLSNPLDAIEQLSFLLFLKHLDEREQDAERAAKTPRQEVHATISQAGTALVSLEPTSRRQGAQDVQGERLPFLKKLGAGRLFRRHMANAEFKINKPSLLIEACKAIDEMQISPQNQDVQGDLYEYLLSKLNTAGRTASSARRATSSA